MAEDGLYALPVIDSADRPFSLLDRLKIDQSFVREIERTPVNESIARAIVSLANSLSPQIVAEGIDTPLAQGVLAQMCCTEGQGFLYAKPLPADQFATWQRAQHGNNVMLLALARGQRIAGARDM